MASKLVPGENLQIETLVPDRIQFLRHSAGALLDFAHLDGHVRIRSAALVFSDQALSAYDCRPAEMCGFGAKGGAREGK